MRLIWDWLTNRIARLLREEGIPGGSVAFATSDQLLFARGFGWRDREEAIPADAATIFGIASVTKSFTAVALASLHQEGRLHLDDPLHLHLPEWDVPDPIARNTVTLRHLLTHTSGLPPLGVRRGVSMGALQHPPTLPVPPDFSTLLRYLREEPYQLLAAPGTLFSYSNEGYALAGAVVQRVAGISYEEFVLTRIIRPLNMTRTTFSEADLARWDNVTRLYERDIGGVRRVEGWPQWGVYAPSGALRSNVLDLLRYTQLFLNPAATGVLTSEMVRELVTPMAEYLPGRYYACGWSIHKWDRFTVIGHSGNQRGISAHVAFVPEVGLVAVALLNVGRGPAEEICHMGLRALLGLPEEPDPMQEGTAKPPGHSLDEYVGVYSSAEGTVVQVSPAPGGSGLEVTFDNDVTSPLKFISDDMAYARLRTRNLPLLFLRDANGRVWAVRYQLRVIARREA